MEVEDFLLCKLRVWGIARRAQTEIPFGIAVGTLPNIHNEPERLKTRKFGDNNTSVDNLPRSNRNQPLIFVFVVIFKRNKLAFYR